MILLFQLLIMSNIFASSSKTFYADTLTNDNGSILLTRPASSGALARIEDINSSISNFVAGPVSSIDGEIVLFNSTSGKLVKAATGSGVVHSTSGAYSVSTVVLTSEVTGILPRANGGTGLSTSGTLGNVLLSNGTDWVSSILAGSNVGNTPTGNIAATDVQSALNELDSEKTGLASPSFTGTPLAPTASFGTNTTQIATTAFVQAAVAYPASSVISALDIDWSLSTAYYKDISANTTFTFSNVIDGKTLSVILTNTSGSSITITLPSPIYRVTGALTVGANEAVIYTFMRANSKTYMGSITTLTSN